MARPDLERRERAREEPPRIDREGGAVGLRLAIGRDGLGIELARRAAIECLDVVELVVRLPHVRFPFDVTGGVAKFRHKRGELERVAVELDARRLAKWAEPKLRGLASAGACSVSVTPRAFGATIGVLGKQGDRVSALAFEIALVPVSEDLVVVVHGARGAGPLPDVPTALAIRATGALLGDAARREGARFVVARAAEKLARRLMPDAGVRAPGADDVPLVGCGEDNGVIFAAFVRGGLAAAMPEQAARAALAAELVREGDDARVAGDRAHARACDLAALERAPRHPEIVRRIAELDARTGGLAESAAAMLRAADAMHTGTLLGDLLVETGDRAGAVAALAREGEAETSAFVGALVLARASALVADPDEALRLLDAAVARASRVAELRWERARRRLALGRLADARADFQAIEALADGPRERHLVLRRAGDVWRDAGLGAEAAALYERALLYKPDDAEALAGLGVALAAEDRAPRGAALVAQAIDLATSRGEPTSAMHLALARILGENLGDRPAAVARLRAVADEAPEAIDARGLEGRYRAALGDDAGATLAFARLRERAGRDPSAVRWLVEAARFEESRGDLAGAQRHLAAAVAIRPHDATLADQYRDVGRRLASHAGVVPLPVAPPAEEASGETSAEPRQSTITAPSGAWPSEGGTRPWDGLAEVADEDPDADVADEARVEELTRKLQADPTNEAVVEELCVLLTKLDRGMELLALLSARLEDAPPDRRDELLPRHRQVLARLEAQARAAGRDAEADLFRAALDST